MHLETWTMNGNEVLEDLRGEDLGRVIKKTSPWGQEELCVLIEGKNRSSGLNRVDLDTDEMRAKMDGETWCTILVDYLVKFGIYPKHYWEFIDWLVE